MVRQKKFGETSKFFQVHRGGGKFFSKNGDQNANVIKVQPQGISVPSLDALRATEGQKKSGKTCREKQEEQEQDGS